MKKYFIFISFYLFSFNSPNNEALLNNKNSNQQDINVYDRNKNLLYTKILDYSLIVNIQEIYDTKKFNDKLLSLNLTISKEEREKIIKNIAMNKTIYIYDKFISVYDKEVLLSTFPNKDLFTFHHNESFSLKSKTLENLFFFQANGKRYDLMRPERILSIDYNKQEILKDKISADFAILFDYTTGEIHAISFNQNEKIFTLFNIKNQYNDFFYLVESFYHCENNSMLVEEPYLYFFTKKKKVSFSSYLKKNKKNNVYNSKVLSVMNNKFTYPIILGDEELYEKEYSDLESLNLYIMHLCQVFQILANDGSISKLTLDYIEQKKNIVGNVISEKILSSFNSNKFFNNFGNYINIGNRHMLYKKNNLLCYIHNNHNEHFDVNTFDLLFDS